MPDGNLVARHDLPMPLPRKSPAGIPKFRAGLFHSRPGTFRFVARIQRRAGDSTCAPKLPSGFASTPPKKDRAAALAQE
jgi:hypothetical protein